MANFGSNYLAQGFANLARGIQSAGQTEYNTAIYNNREAMRQREREDEKEFRMKLKEINKQNQLQYAEHQDKLTRGRMDLSHENALERQNKDALNREQAANIDFNRKQQLLFQNAKLQAVNTITSNLNEFVHQVDTPYLQEFTPQTLISGIYDAQNPEELQMAMGNAINRLGKFVKVNQAIDTIKRNAPNNYDNIISKYKDANSGQFKLMTPEVQSELFADAQSIVAQRQKSQKANLVDALVKSLRFERGVPEALTQTGLSPKDIVSTAIDLRKPLSSSSRSKSTSESQQPTYNTILEAVKNPDVQGMNDLIKEAAKDYPNLLSAANRQKRLEEEISKIEKEIAETKEKQKKDEDYRDDWIPFNEASAETLSKWAKKIKENEKRLKEIKQQLKEIEPEYSGGSVSQQNNSQKSYNLYKEK